MHSNSCDQLTNTTLFDEMYAKYATPVADAAGDKLYGFKTMPKTRKEAYEIWRQYYNERVAFITSVGDTPYSSMAKVNSVTCTTNMEIYAALWNSQGPNNGSTTSAALELQCKHANSAFAMARGGSRRSGKVWTVQPSGWGYGPTPGGCGSLHCNLPNGSRPGACTIAEMGAGASCRGIEVRNKLHAWRLCAKKASLCKLNGVSNSCACMFRPRTRSLGTGGFGFTLGLRGRRKSRRRGRVWRCLRATNRLATSCRRLTASLGSVSRRARCCTLLAHMSAGRH